MTVETEYKKNIETGLINQLVFHYDEKSKKMFVGKIISYDKKSGKTMIEIDDDLSNDIQ